MPLKLYFPSEEQQNKRLRRKATSVNSEIESIFGKKQKMTKHEDQNQRLKLIWDFKGPEAERTADHHSLHLKQYAKEQKLRMPLTGTEKIDSMHSMAYLVVYKQEMPAVRDALRPHRGQMYLE